MQSNSFYSKYKYIKALGSGGCGKVFLARNIALGNLWAVKEIVKGRETTISGYIEPEILKRVNHPALPRICDVFEDDDKIYIVEDYLEGTCLKQKLDEKGKFEEPTVIDWAIQLCDVLEYLHSQKPSAIIYGDMKPHNIILTKEGFVKLIDFGVSAMVSETNNKYEEACNSNKYNDNTIPQTAFIGTKGYAAPEQFTGNGISRASDIYSLGITIIQLLTGFDPLTEFMVFQNDRYARNISPELHKIIKRCIHYNPVLRYRSAGILKKEFCQYNLKYGVCSKNDLIGLKSTFDFAKVIAISGARGTGVSTITAAIAEYMAREPTSVCIVDLSKSGLLEKGIFVSEICKSDSEAKNLLNNISKINSNLYYLKLNSLARKVPSEMLTLHKYLGELQKRFSYIVLDVDMTLLTYLEQYLNHIFLVSDMNPFNLSAASQVMRTDGLAAKCIFKTSFVINKFYMGEISSHNILQSILLTEDATAEIQDLTANANIFEVPYEQKIYLKWMYSYFGEALSFKRLMDEGFRQAILNILSDTILPARRKKSRFTFKKLLSKVVI
ncbi:serine/threonine-protein kinase [Ruminiclostridium sufflavum DSM 19573]|uniref:Serine/threonine-protein kinase n=1 Tax=Ruminiclostridium sufflavum DSM 19573 TaxID=1121337 RepID=A0A318XMP6_9FIRM|nr:serine/threonine-protein kinase [Ruminiclostridium sufflavum]PYG89132.1 serine/threonine-protein kinase [Ruminiclostridium sufflavum DSM 19573]